MVKPQFEVGREHVSARAASCATPDAAARGDRRGRRRARARWARPCSASRRPGCPARRATARRSCGSAEGGARGVTDVGAAARGGRRVKAAVDRAHPPARRGHRRRAARADRRRPRARASRCASTARRPASTASAGRGDRARRGAPIDDVDLCIVLGGDGTILTALREYAGIGRARVRGQLRRGRVPRHDRPRRARRGLRPGASRATSSTLALPTIAVGRPDGELDRDQRHLRPPQAGAARRRPRVRAGGGGDRARALRRARRRDPAGLDRLQPRQRRPGAGLGRARASSSPSSRRTRSPRARSSSPPTTC